MILTWLHTAPLLIRPSMDTKAIFTQSLRGVYTLPLTCTAGEVMLFYSCNLAADDHRFSGGVQAS